MAQQRGEASSHAIPTDFNPLIKKPQPPHIKTTDFNPPTRGVASSHAVSKDFNPLIQELSLLDNG
jgi:hypothetical protein